MAINGKAQQTFLIEETIELSELLDLKDTKEGNTLLLCLACMNNRTEKFRVVWDILSLSTFA